MPVRTRTNRAEKVIVQQLLMSGQVFNDKGLPNLPDELYLEIVSKMPTYPIPQRDMDQKKLDECHLRHTTLIALSQTCRSLRRVFLRYLWQRIEVREGMMTGKGPLQSLREVRRLRRQHPQTRRYPEELIRQLEVVTIREPTLAQHVNVLNVVMLPHSFAETLFELLRCLALFPNLHTIQLNLQLVGHDIRRVFDAKFYLKNTAVDYVDRVASSLKALYTYPSVRRLSFECLASFQFLACCPAVTHIFWSPSRIVFEPSFEIARLFKAYGPPNLQVLGAVPWNIETAGVIVKQFPNLQEISLDSSAFQYRKQLLQLSQLTELRTIQIDPDSGVGKPMTSMGSPVHEWKALAESILSEVGGSRIKQVHIRNE